MFDAQDPALRITVGKDKKETARIVDAGTAASFPETFEFELPSGTTSQNIEIEVLNVGGSMLSSTKHVGSGTANLEDILSAPNKEKDMTIKLTYKKKKEKGIVNLHAKVIDNEASAEKKPDADTITPPTKKESDPSPSENKSNKKDDLDKHHKEEEPKKNELKKEPVKEDVSNNDIKAEPDKTTKPEPKSTQPAQSQYTKAEVETPFDFEKSLLCIKKVCANDLKSVESFGKNDPFVQFKFGDWKGTTDAHTNAGANTEWIILPTDESMQLEVTPTQLEKTKMKVDVIDQNDVFSDTFIGNCDLDLSCLLKNNDFEKVKSLTSKIFSKKGKETGAITVEIALKEIHDEKPPNDPKEEVKNKNLELLDEKVQHENISTDEIEQSDETKDDPSPSAGPDTLPLSFEKAHLKISKIEANKLKDVEGFLRGKNDPFLELSFGELWKSTTVVLNEGGQDVTWDIAPDDSSMHFIVSPAELRALKMNITAYDKNISIIGDSLIGSGENYMESALNKQYGEVNVVKFQLKDKKTEKSGEVFVHFHLEKIEVTVKPETTRSDGDKEIQNNKSVELEPFISGTIEIHTVKCTDLKNVEMWGKNDPYVKLAFSGSEWVDATQPLDNVDTPVWKDLDMDIEVTADMIEEDHISVEVWDLNTATKDKFIGRGSTNLSRLKQTLDSQKPVDLVIPLFDEKEKSVGNTIIYATLKRYIEKKSMATDIDEAYNNGSLIIERIRAKNLINTEMMGKQDPYVILKLNGKDDLQSSYKEGGGSIVVWNSLDMKFKEVSREVMQNDKILVEVWDHNSMLKDKIIGSGCVTFCEAGAQLGKTVELVVDLQTKSGGVAGKIVLDVKAIEGVYTDVEEEKEYEINDGFTEGKVHIKKISVFNAANTELMGGQQDLYASLSFKDWNSKTTVQSDIGSDAVWENLDMNFSVTADDLKTSHLIVKLFDDNVMKDTLIGSNEKVSLLKAGAAVGELVEIKVNLPPDKKGKSTGRLILYVEIKEHEDDKENFEVIETFEAGCIHIEKICGYNLNELTKNKKIKPSVKVKFDKFEETTDMSSGGNPVWDLMSIRLPTTRDNLVNSKLSIEVFHNKKALVGTGEVSVMKAGASINNQVELKIDIVDKSQQLVAYIIAYMTVKEESMDAAISKSQAPEEDIQLPPDFLQGVIFITSIKSFGLKNPDFFGKADPYVEVLFESKLGNFCEKTPVYKNAGEQVVWDEVNMKVKVTADDILAKKKITVNAWDENSGKDTNTGSGEITMRKLVRSYGNEVTLNIDLKDNKGKRAGRLVMVAELRESEPEQETFLPSDFTAGILKVIQICSFDLKNLEMIGAGKQDPYVKVRAGDFYDEKTYEKEEGGSDVVWDYLDMAIPVSADFLTSSENYLELEAWDSNVIKDEMIGKGEVSLKSVVNIGEEVELFVPLYDHKKQSTGRLTILVRLENLPPVEVEIDPDFQEGTMSIRRIVAHRLKNTDWFGKGDPYVLLSLENWEGHTNSLTDSGSNVMWDFLDMKLVVNVDMLKANDKSKRTIVVAVKDKNSLRKDALIGTGEVDISEAFATLGNEVELSVDLLDEKSKVAGTLVLYSTVTNGVEPDEKDLKVSPDFEFGTLNIGKIRSFELKNTELIGLQDPFVELQLGSWEDKTYTKDEGGGDVLWDFLDLHCDVTAEMLSTERMMITVWDENKGLKNALIGRGSCSLVKPGAYVGKEVEVTVNLTDDKDKYSGRLVLFFTLHNEAELQEGVIPNTFTRGELRVRRINGFSLKNTEWIGKQDPYVILKMGDMLHLKTKALEGAGSNPSWKQLDYKCILSARAVKVEDVEVEVWDKNKTSDTIIGQGHVSLRQAACFLGTEVELRTSLVTKKGKAAGRLNIGVVLKELPPEAVDVDLKLPKSFKSGIIHFHKIIARGLQNKEFAGGKQDPYVMLELASWKNRTKTLSNVGNTAIWPDIEGIFTEVDESILADCKLKATVMDENTLTSHSFLGSGSISLRKLAPKINSPVELSVDLSENGVPCGRLEVHATLREALPEEIVETVDESLITLNKGSITVKKVETIDIIGGDSSLLDNKQDQYVVIQLQRWTWKTPVQDNVGASATCDDLTGVVTEVNGDILKQELIKVTVYDKNKVTSDELIGSGTAPLRYAGSHLNEDVPIRIRLMDKHSMPVGRAILTVQVNAHTVENNSHGDELLPNERIPKFGFLSFTEISAKNLKNTEFFGTQDPYAIISLGTNFKMQTEVLQDAGSNPIWKTEISKKIVSAQLSRDKIHVTIMHHNKKKGDLLGEGKVTGIPLLAKKGEWVELSHDLVCNNKPAGSFTLKGQYRPANEDEQKEHDDEKESKAKNLAPKLGTKVDDSSSRKEVQALNGIIKDMKASQQDLLNRLGGMENSISKQLHEELAAERKRLSNILSKQSDRIEQSLEKVSSQNKVEESASPWHGMTISELQNISLPRNVHNWRAAHIQAWISLKMDLPQYIQQFHDASIDGILLLKFVDDEVLKDTLGVSIPLHRHKIMAGIASLREKQNEYDRKKEEERKEAARLATEQEAARLNAMKAKTKKKKKKSKKAPEKAATWFGDVREHNDLERVRLERIMREKRASQQKAKTQHNARSGVWKFEYTGGPRPIDPAQEVWTDPKASGNNTVTYERNMSNLFSTELATTMPTAQTYKGKLRSIPKDSVFDEVLALTRAAMFDVSTRLIQVEMMNDKKNIDLNDDLDSFGGVEETQPEFNNDVIDDVDMEPPAFDDTDDNIVLAESIPIASGGVGNSNANYNETSALIGNTTLTEQKKYDRTGLIYDAFVNQTNNDAKWLGSNDKLTRLKFYGGFETILRLKCPWPQFDVLWNKLDSARSGELDKNEFKAFFGDFSEFESSSSHDDFGNLAEIMYDLCNALRTAGFTVIEIFSSFDRNGSGEVSVSEFCSMLRVVLGKRIDKKKVFRSFALMDVDSSRSISCNEVMMLIYNVWKSQMKELADRLAILDEDYDGPLIDKVVRERNLIKEAVKKNFPREWRDRMERSKQLYSSGPFGNLMEKLNVTKSSNEKGCTVTFKSQDFSPDETYGSYSPKPPQKSKKLSQSAKAGRNEMLRYKINTSRTYTPTRKGATLGVPHTTNLGENAMTTEGSAVRRLHQTEPVGNKVFTLTS